jgi:hypothetical protein
MRIFHVFVTSFLIGMPFHSPGFAGTVLTTERSEPSISDLPWRIDYDRVGVKSESLVYVRFVAWRKHNGEKEEVFRTTRFGPYRDFEMTVIVHSVPVEDPRSQQQMFRYRIEGSSESNNGVLGFAYEEDFERRWSNQQRYWNGFYLWENGAGLKIGRNPILIEGPNEVFDGIRQVRPSDDLYLETWKVIDNGFLIEAVIEE